MFMSYLTGNYTQTHTHTAYRLTYIAYMRCGILFFIVDLARFCYLRYSFFAPTERILPNELTVAGTVRN